MAHLNVDHNLPAQGDIASLSPRWSGFLALAQRLADPRDCRKKKTHVARGPITGLRVGPMSPLASERF